jgi:thioredoxin 1
MPATGRLFYPPAVASVAGPTAKEQEAMAGSITQLTASTFDEVVGSASEPLIVDFWAEWCGPCKMIAPILDEIATEHEGKLQVAKLNVDDAPDVARRFEVMSIPTLLVFRDGQVAKRVIGAKGKTQLLDDLAEFI